VLSRLPSAWAKTEGWLQQVGGADACMDLRVERCGITSRSGS
jgi:hypothetical protein